MLDTMDFVNQVTETYPPETGHESRFGNPAFRKFYDQIALVSVAEFGLGVTCLECLGCRLIWRMSLLINAVCAGMDGEAALAQGGCT